MSRNKLANTWIQITIWWFEFNQTLRFFHNAHCSIYPGGGYSKKVLYGEAPPRGPTPYPFIYHFFRKGTPFVYLLLGVYLFEFKNFLVSFKNAFHKSFLMLIYLHLNSAKYDKLCSFSRPYVGCLLSFAANDSIFFVWKPSSLTNSTKWFTGLWMYPCFERFTYVYISLPAIGNNCCSWFNPLLD